MRVIVWVTASMVLVNLHPNFMEFRVEGPTWLLMAVVTVWAVLMDIIEALRL